MRPSFVFANRQGRSDQSPGRAGTQPALIAQGRVSRRRRSPAPAHARADGCAHAPDPIPTMCAVVTMPRTIQAAALIATAKTPGPPLQPVAWVTMLSVAK
ncbi:hypothetical protein SXCC_03081 [Gluconacetobacter sp. SXCC-1]|nr:hypothetical protein SXCC_03081 [Gluconacetobacter sp. SXCC-1]